MKFEVPLNSYMMRDVLSRCHFTRRGFTPLDSGDQPVPILSSDSSIPPGAHFWILLDSGEEYPVISNSSGRKVTAGFKGERNIVKQGGNYNISRGQVCIGTFIFGVFERKVEFHC